MTDLKKTAANAWAALKELPSLQAQLSTLNTEKESSAREFNEKYAVLKKQLDDSEKENAQLKDACKLLASKNTELVERVGKLITEVSDAANAARSLGYDRGFTQGKECGVESMKLGNRLARLLGFIE